MAVRLGVHGAPAEMDLLQNGRIHPFWKGWFDTVRAQFNSSLQLSTGSTAASPFVYANRPAQLSHVVATVHFFVTSAIGNVSAVALSRDGGATYVALPVQTMYTISGGDLLKLTFSGTLTSTIVPQ